MTSAPPRLPGTYVLVFYAPKSAEVVIGALGETAFQRGYYLYVGSAHGGGGLQARVNRHLKTDKPKRWHMDYLRPSLRPKAVWWQASTHRLENHWVTLMPQLNLAAVIDGFGASDSPHPSHLFYSKHRPNFKHWLKLAPGSQLWTPGGADRELAP